MPNEVWSEFHGARYQAESLATEGFIHCSFDEQLPDVLRRYYSDFEEVTILEIDPQKLDSRLVVEPSTGGEHYPHIYGSINVEAIVGCERRRIT